LVTLLSVILIYSGRILGSANLDLVFI